MPHGYGQRHGALQAALEGRNVASVPAQGPQINRLSSSDWCDPLSKTPYHKHIAVSVTKRVQPAGVSLDRVEVADLGSGP